MAWLMEQSDKADTVKVERIIEGGATVFVAGLGIPSEVVELCHANGVLVVNMCGKVDHARRALDAGCDMVVAQGTEAGGHTGLVATMPLVPQIVDAVGGQIPVVAAGGIFDGRGLAAALALGAGEAVSAVETSSVTIRSVGVPPTVTGNLSGIPQTSSEPVTGVVVTASERPVAAVVVSEMAAPTPVDVSVSLPAVSRPALTSAVRPPRASF